MSRKNSDAAEDDVREEVSKPPAENALLWEALARLVGYNELARDATTLGGRMYLRLARDHALDQYVALGGKVEQAPAGKPAEKPAIVVPTKPPFLVLTSADFELMRAALAEHDIASGAEPSEADARIEAVAEILRAGCDCDYCPACRLTTKVRAALGLPDKDGEVASAVSGSDEKAEEIESLTVSLASMTETVETLAFETDRLEVRVEEQEKLIERLRITVANSDRISKNASRSYAGVVERAERAEKERDEVRELLRETQVWVETVEEFADLDEDDKEMVGELRVRITAWLASEGKS